MGRHQPFSPEFADNPLFGGSVPETERTGRQCLNPRSPQGEQTRDSKFYGIPRTPTAAAGRKTGPRLKASCSVKGMQIQVEPATGLVDRPPSVQVFGAMPDQTVSLLVKTTDAAGRDWQQRLELVADRNGECSTERLADPTQLWWGMQPVVGGDLASAFTPSATELDFSVAVGGKKTTVRRSWLHKAHALDSVPGDGFVLHRYLPDEVTGPAPGVLIIPGSTGPDAVAPIAALLASRGYATAVLAYLYEPGLPASLASIPVEALARGIEVFAGLPEVDAERIGVAAWSVGTGGALSSLAAFPDLPVAAAAMMAPTCAMWQGLPQGSRRPPAVSSWTLAGESLPYLRMHGEQLIPELIKNEFLDKWPGHDGPKALHMRKAYDAALSGLKIDGPEMIPVEKVPCPLLVCSGENDALWPSEPMARLLRQRRGVRPQDVYDVYHGGHMFRTPVIPTTVLWNEDFYFGGTSEANAVQYRESWRAQLDFWDQHLGA